MFLFIFQQFIFYLTLAVVLFLPGYLLLRAYQGRNRFFSKIESPILSLALSIAIIDFIILFLDKIGISLTRASILLGILFFCAGALLFFKLRIKRQKTHSAISKTIFSSKQTLIALSLIFATILIKTIYLGGAILPSATDLGHHMYWSQAIINNGEVPIYEKAEITTANTLQNEPIADFIIGEHLIFAAISLISGASVISAFPVLTLFLIHLATLGALFILTLALFRKHPQRNTIALLVLFFGGPLYAISSPQMKFISGGVIGNTIGNLFIPLTIYFLFRALSEKKAAFLAFTIFSGLGLAYTHHLSTFVFIFITLFSLTIFIVTNLHLKTLLEESFSWIKLFFKPASLLMLIFSFVFVFLIYTPTYLNVKAVDTAVGTPSKATRIGLSIPQLSETAGEARMALGLVGITLLLFSVRRKEYASALIVGWSGALVIMSLRPQWLLIDIPSNRIASYIVFPFIILSAYALATGISYLKNEKEPKLLIQPVFFVGAFFMLMIYALQSGNKENTAFIDYSNNSQNVVQTYRAADYLAKNTDASDIILKDHNYLAADSWIKLFFMRGYNYPLSRGYFKRYEDITKPREMCTYHMITTPASTEAKACFEGTHADFLMVNPTFDSAQFKKSREFWQVYASEDVTIYHKN